MLDSLTETELESASAIIYDLLQTKTEKKYTVYLLIRLIISKIHYHYMDLIKEFNAKERVQNLLISLMHSVVQVTTGT